MPRDLPTGTVLLKHPTWIPHVGDPGFIGAFMVRHKLVEHYDAEGSDYEQGPSFGLGAPMDRRFNQA